MSLIDKIRCSNHYDFIRVLRRVDFDNLDKYINVHDATEINLLLWMTNEGGYNESRIIQYVDKYYELFDYDKQYNNNESLLMKLIVSYNPNIYYYLIEKINFIKETIKININGANLINYMNYYNHSYFYKLHNMINSTGILNKPFNRRITDVKFIVTVDINVYYYQYKVYNKKSEYIINYFGVLNIPSVIINSDAYDLKRFTKTTKRNKLILVYGKY
jgi:hypothetical protein